MTRTVIIHNAGTETLAGEIELVGGLTAFTITSGGGWVTLPPGETHTVTIDVAPPAQRYVHDHAAARSAVAPA